MPRPLNDRIAAVKAQQEKLAARLNTLSSKAKQEERKLDTRRKIIVGGMVLAAMEKDESFAARVSALLGAYVERPNDRAVIAHLLPPGAAVPAVGAPAPAPTMRASAGDDVTVAVVEMATPVIGDVMAAAGTGTASGEK